MRGYGILLVMLVAAACSPFGGTDEVIRPASVGSETYQVGQSVYSAQCASCHGANGEGQFPDAPLERDATGRFGAPPHDETGHSWHHDDDLLLEYIQEGGMGSPADFYPMPGFENVLTDNEMRAVLAYIKTMWTPEQQAAQRQQTLDMRARSE
jgi:mono/diheme cytochrome c family protein